MPLPFLLLLLFIGLPLLELYILIKVGAQIGAFATVFLVVLTAVLGGVVLRLQGLATTLRVREAMARGELPAIAMLEGALLAVGGILLLLPGFVTDAMGLLCLIPAVRRALVLGFFGRAQVRGADTPPRSPADRRIIDAEYRREDD